MLIFYLIYSTCSSIVWSSFIVLAQMWRGIYCWIQCQI